MSTSPLRSQPKSSKKAVESTPRASKEISDERLSDFKKSLNKYLTQVRFPFKVAFHVEFKIETVQCLSLISIRLTLQN